MDDTSTSTYLVPGAFSLLSIRGKLDFWHIQKVRTFFSWRWHWPYAPRVRTTQIIEQQYSIQWAMLHLATLSGMTMLHGHAFMHLKKLNYAIVDAETMNTHYSHHCSGREEYPALVWATVLQDWAWAIGGLNATKVQYSISSSTLERILD